MKEVVLVTKEDPFLREVGEVSLADESSPGLTSPHLREDNDRLPYAIANETYDIAKRHR